MFRLSIIVGSLIVCMNAFCQVREIPLKAVYKCRIDTNLLKEPDSNILEVVGHRIEIEKLYIQFKNVYFNTISKELSIKGRVYIRDSSNIGMAKVSIYRGILKNWELHSIKEIGETSSDKEGFTNDGFFDLSFKLEKDETIFFSFPNFFVEAFEIGKLSNPLWY